MKIEGVASRVVDGRPVLDLTIDGHPAFVLEPKRALLDAGLVVLLDASGYWERSISAAYKADGRTIKIPGATADPKVIAEVRAWQQSEEGCTITCRLTFEDGEVLEATAHSALAGESVPIAWSGPLERIPDLRREAPANYLPALCRAIAEKNGLCLAVESRGKFLVEE